MPVYTSHFTILLADTMAGTGARPSAFKSLCPIHVFDVVDITVMMEFSANVLTNTQAYALVISDRMLKFKSDG